MKKLSTTGAILLLLAISLSSCLSDNDNNSVAYSHDTGISLFNIGEVKRTMHTTSSTGEDSVYTTTYDAGKYAFEINQMTGEIFNVDSLLYGTDPTKVLISAQAKNSGVVYVKLRNHANTADSITPLLSTDSLDLTNPIELQVANQANTARRTYKVTLLIHKQQADDFAWTACSDVPTHVSQLIDERTANVTEAQWLKEERDADDEWLPTEDLNLLEWPLKTNEDAVQLLLVGNRSAADYPDDATAQVWGRIVESDADAVSHPWVYYVQDEKNKHLLPRMKDLQVVCYDDMLLAIGGTGLGKSSVEAYETFYESKDGGITWFPSTTYEFPEGFQPGSGKVLLVVDEENYLWVICEETGQVWRGRLNRLGWHDRQTIFTE